MSALFVVAMIVFFLLLDLGVQRAKAARTAGEPRPAISFSLSDLEPMLGVFLAPGHTWAKLRGDGDVGVGVDSFACQAVGMPDQIDLPRVGAAIAKGDPVITMIRDGRKLVFRSPVSGRVTAVNPSPTRSPADRNLFTIEPARLGSELKALRVADEAKAWLESELGRFRDFLVETFRTSPAMATLPDGGVPAEGALALLDDEAWHDFEDEFLGAES